MYPSTISTFATMAFVPIQVTYSMDILYIAFYAWYFPTAVILLENQQEGKPQERYMEHLSESFG